MASVSMELEEPEVAESSVIAVKARKLYAPGCVALRCQCDSTKRRKAKMGR